MRTTFSSIFFVMGLTTLFFVGCNKDTSTPTTATNETFIITPIDNQTDVSTSGTIALSFSKKIDRSVVEKSFRLINEKSFIDSLCPTSKTMHHGTMSGTMGNSQMMNHLDSIHTIRGTFTWSSDSLHCTFKPDSLLLPGSLHMVHLQQQMETMMEQNMGSMGMMGSSGMGTNMGMSFHFTTKK